jgi:hypothetical protein
MQDGHTFLLGGGGAHSWTSKGCIICEWHIDQTTDASTFMLSMSLAALKILTHLSSFKYVQPLRTLNVLSCGESHSYLSVDVSETCKCSVRMQDNVLRINEKDWKWWIGILQFHGKDGLGDVPSVDPAVDTVLTKPGPGMHRVS